MNSKYNNSILLMLVIVALICSGIYPHDFFTWFLEVLPVLIGMVILIGTYKKFKFSTFVYCLLAVHAVILIIGGHYTYAQMPVFNWLRDTFDLSRNYYDRLGHFAQGFIPAITAREILLRKSPLKAGKLLDFIVVCICLAISASYELIEFAVAKMTGEAAEAFLGTQGDIWDTQWDMLMALIGVITALIIFRKYHDRIFSRMKNN